MFKGLKAKIEVEQRNQGSLTPAKNHDHPNRPNNSNITTNDHKTGLKNSQPNDGKSTQRVSKEPADQEAPRRDEFDSSAKVVGEDRNPTKQGQFPPFNGNISITDKNEIDLKNSLNPDLPATELVSKLREELIELRITLRSITRERDQSNIQNEELCQTIESLKKQLETERESNLNLLKRLRQFDSSFSANEPGSARLIRPNSNISIKTFNPLDSSVDEIKDIGDIEQLRTMLIESRNQLNEKNRQLKIRSQNVNDIKKALQKELLDHSKTQEELSKLQNQIKQQNQQSLNQTRNLINDPSYSDSQNGSTGDMQPLDNPNYSNKTVANNPNYQRQFNLRNSDNITNQIQPNDSHSDAPDGLNNHQQHHHHMRMMSQLDGISFHSGLSVDDYDSSDLQNQREVNHEYLRNVLYRYMTSTDTATAQHLIRALSVLMNFTPEQTAAITKAMNARNSWLRLSK